MLGIGVCEQALGIAAKKFQKQVVVLHPKVKEEE